MLIWAAEGVDHDLRLHHVAMDCVHKQETLSHCLVPLGIQIFWESAWCDFLTLRHALITAGATMSLIVID